MYMSSIINMKNLRVFFKKRNKKNNKMRQIEKNK